MKLPRFRAYFPPLSAINDPVNSWAAIPIRPGTRTDRPTLWLTPRKRQTTGGPVLLCVSAVSMAVSGRPTMKLVEPGFVGSGIDTGESSQRNWISHNEPRCQQQQAGEESPRSKVTATLYLLPVFHPRRIHVAKQPMRHYYSDSQPGRLPTEALGRERGSGRSTPAHSALSTAAPSRSVDREFPTHAPVRRPRTLQRDRSSQSLFVLPPV
jgi:hypothetical protein